VSFWLDPSMIPSGLDGACIADLEQITTKVELFKLSVSARQ